MALPTKDEISQAIEKTSSLSVPQLEGFLPINGILGPESYAGGFCIVFPFQKRNAKKAVRVWHQEIGKIKQRYNLISPDIHKYGAPYLCDVEFIEKALVVDRTLIDVMVMDWVEGQPLKKYLQSIIESNELDSKKKSRLSDLAKKLLDMFEYFHQLHFSHGDLQHDNILITENGEIKVIDYDCFYTPALGLNFYQTTSGYKGYQHPSRFNNHIISNEKVDYFSELIIYLSIIAISEDLELWEIAKDSDFSFLFSEQDFYGLETSDIYNKINQLSQECRDLLAVLKKYLGIQSINDLFPFTDALLKNKILFSASSDKVIRNSQSVTIKWEVPFEASVSLSDTTSNTVNVCSSKGNINAQLNDDTDYVLTVETNDGQHIEKRLTIRVFDECDIEFSADKYFVFPTIPVTLTWDVKHANRIWLDNEEVNASGKKVIEPQKAMTCVLSAEDEFGIKEKRLDIQMLPVPIVKSIMAPTPNLVSNQSVTIQQPRYNVDVKFPQIDIGWIKMEVPKVPSLTELGLNIELSPPLPKVNLMSSIKRVINHIIRK